MAYNKDQNELPLPGDGKQRRKSSQHLPRYFRSEVNNKFLSSTLDQLIQPGVAEKLNGYVGRKSSPGHAIDDFYIGDVNQQRENYQLEPAAVIKDDLGNVNFYRDYNDYINQIKNLDGTVDDHSILNRQEYYAWNPHINWDKFVNFREYYWLPDGPQAITVSGVSDLVVSTYTVRSIDNTDNFAYILSPDGITQNPQLTLYRGVTYRFEIDTPGLPFSLRSKRENAPAWVPETLYSIGERVFYQNTIYKSLQDFRASKEFTDDASKWEIDTTFNLTREVSDNGVEKGVIEFTPDNGTPNEIYYVADTDVNAGNLIRIYDIDEASSLDVGTEILGKKTYTTNSGIEISNGMKLSFQGTVIPEKYNTGNWYVEGVGDKIVLISEVELNVPSSFTTDLEVSFDNDGFDNLPYSEAIGYPVNKDYITINRGSKDGNLWSKYNRWFHKSIIEKSASINGIPANIDQTKRAVRPIIEFESNLKLFNFGTQVKSNIDLVDDFTIDVFSTIEGSEGYNVDGVDLANGMRVMFTADTDERVNGRIYEVSFILFGNSRQIALLEVEDSAPIENEVVLCKNGEVYKGKMLFYNGTRWQLAQDKTTINQSPLFDIYDVNGNSLGDTNYYESQDFTGTKLFSYKVGSGTNDTELGFPLSYRSIQNVGDLVFNFDLLSDGIAYVDESYSTTLSGIGYLRKYNGLSDFEYVNGWKKADTLSSQNVIRQYDVDNTRISYPIDVYDESALLEDLWIRVFVNNQIQQPNIDYTLTTNNENQSVINFTVAPNYGDVIKIKTRSSAVKNENGYYEIANNFERNPLNENITEFTLGEVNDHVRSIVEEADNFDGLFPGVSNLRDITDITKYGKRIVKHSAPMNLALYHLLDKESNLVKAIKYARREYGKYKRTFIKKAEELGFDGPVKTHVDLILREMLKDKTNTMPFYFTDMIPTGASTRNVFEINDIDLQFFALTYPFSLENASDKAVQIYQNGIQLVHGVDYTFNSEGFAIITTIKQIGDVIEIYEYESTNGSFCPATPTKLGLYPKYIPTKFIDDRYLEPTEVIQGHDGSIIKTYGDFRDELILEFERRIYNNLKVEYDKDLFDISDYVPSEYRNTGVTKKQLDDTMLSDFVQWLQLVDNDYTDNINYIRENSFTFNHKGMLDPSGNAISGWWRGIYKWAYDTDRPHTHPWEMQGFTIKPTWWDEQYGEAPYTSNNFLLWEDIQNGIVRNAQGSYTVNEKYKRPDLLDHLPVDENGELVSPVYSGYVKEFITTDLDFNFVYGDHSPVETTWRNSSEYPFALVASIFVNQPNRSMSVAWDRLRQKRGLVDDIIYDNPNVQLKLSNIVFPNTIKDTQRVYTSGFVNYVFDYLSSDVTVTYDSYKNNLKNISNFIGFKLGGYTSKDKFKLLLDSRTPLNEGNVFVPEENYKIFLNTSSPIKNITYSGVIIEKQSYGFVVKGYNVQQPYFTYYRPFEIESDPVINVGGVSQTFILWDSNKLYSAGSIVEFENNYYRVTTTHTSTTEFDSTKFAKIPELPVVGGRQAVFRRTFSTIPEKVSYGTVYTTIQQVVDFLLGYGKYLESQGFVFDYFDEENGFIADWQTSSKEFMFWTTQNWGAGSVITLSPGAFQIKFNSEYSIVDDIYDTFYGYSLFKADGKKLEPQNARLTRENPNEFVIKPKATADGIFGIRLSLVQKEHVVLIDNKTVFGDIIYDQEPGYRQERIKVLGYRTTDWDGSLNVPGFIFDNARVTEWEQWKDYAIGDLVKYKEFFYTARNKVPGNNVFDANQWVRLSEDPEMKLIPNFEYKVNQFADFYDLDTDNFDIEQQKFAQHLIGYQNRDYLANIINDDVSQYKFYQGMIQDKGTQNALDKLFNVLSSADKDSLEFYEEWAIKCGQYGAADGFEEVEYKLDESKMRLSPQSFELVDRITGLETDLVYRIQPFETYLRPQNYNHAPFPEKYVTKTYTKNSGYVNSEDVEFVLNQYNSLLSLTFANIREGDKFWIGNDNLIWNVYTALRTDYNITSIEQLGSSGKLILDTTRIDDISKDDIIGVYNIDGIASFYKVSSVSGTAIEVLDDTGLASATETENLNGRIIKFVDSRVDDIDTANKLLQQNKETINRLWIDKDAKEEWLVLDRTDAFQEKQILVNETAGEDANFGVALAVNKANTVLVIGAPDSNNGKVFVYTRAGSVGTWKVSQILDADNSVADNGQRFGAALAVSTDGRYLVIGSPDASNVTTLFKDNFVESSNYSDRDIVRYQDSLWQATTDILGAVDNIVFGSFESIARIRTELNLTASDSENTPTLMTGNYPFTGTEVDHIIVRAPLDMYQGSGIGDTLKLKWNTLSYAYQDQIQDELEAVEPFQGDIPGLDSSFISGDHTIQEKIDVILFVPEANVIPLIGQVVEVAGGFGTVSYTFNPSTEQDATANTTIYLKDVNGSFGTAGSLTTTIGEFVGEYETVAPIDEVIGYDEYWGGYWKINLPANVNVDQINSDTGRGLVYFDIVPNGEADPNRFYYNILDYRADEVLANNPFYSDDDIYTRIANLSYYGAPGPLNVTDDFASNIFVVKAPDELTNNLNVVAPGDDDNDTIDLFYNSLPQFEDGVWQPLTNYVSGTVLKYATSAYDTIYWRVKTAHTSPEEFLDNNDQFNSLFYEPLDGLIFKDPSDIGLAIETLNKTHKVYDIYDGFIDVELTIPNPLDQNLFKEPKVGLTIRDTVNGGTAEIAFYQKFNGQDTRLYLKNVSGTWAAGQKYGDNRSVEYLSSTDPADAGTEYDLPPKNDGSPGSAEFGQIRTRSFSLPQAGIGKLIAIDAGFPLPVTEQQVLVNVTGQNVSDGAQGPEYWFSREGDVFGIPRTANAPAENNNDWTEVFNLPVVAGGTSSGLEKEGMYTVFERRGTGLYNKLGAFAIPDRSNYNKLGHQLKMSKSGDLYKLFVKSLGSYPQNDKPNNLVYDDSKGRIYIINNGVNDDYSFGWEFSRDKQYRGQYQNTRTYFENDIVYYDGNLYESVTNMAPGLFDISNWTLLETNKDYLGYIPNDTGLLIGDDISTVLDQDLLAEFAESFDVSENGEVLVVSVKYEDSKDNSLVVYRNDGGSFVRYQKIPAPSKTTEYGSTISISADGRIIAVGAPFNDDKGVDFGKVYIYKQVNGIFELSQELYSPAEDKAELFGYKVDFDGNNLVVGCRNGDSFVQDTFDSNTTTFDNDLTKIRSYDNNSGVIRVYERIDDSLIYGQMIDFDDSSTILFGSNIKVSNNHIYAGMPLVEYSANTAGTVVDFYKQKDIWSVLRQSKPTVDVNKIKRVMLYNTLDNEIIQYLDYVDVLQGKIPGPAEQELSYKTYYDPATYTVGTGVNVDTTNSWGEIQVGKLWWDLTTAKFINPYQSDVIFSANNWNKKYSNTNSINVYEWVKSTVLPEEWDKQAGTERGASKGISGKSKYGNNAYVTKQVYDKASKTFTTYYYFWVGQKTTVPNIEDRTLSANSIAQLIEDPAGQGYRFVSFISPTQFALYNCESLIRGNEVAISVQYWTIEDQDINIHNQYQVISDGLETSKPNRDIEQKWFDSLIGWDLADRPVPAPELSIKERYGILNRPRQTWFVNRVEALKEVVNRINSVLLDNLIVDDKNLNRLTEKEAEPSVASRLFDTTVDTVTELQFVGVSKANQASLTPVVENGEIVRVEINQPGRGYLQAPTVEVFGTGQNAVIETVIDSNGKITDTNIINAGENYNSSNTSISVRRFTVLVKSDSTVNGRWALYERDTTTDEWIRVASQSYDVNQYWQYVDWYEDGYSQFTEINQSIDFAYELQGLDNEIGDIVKIQSVGTGGWLLLEKIDNQTGVDYTINYQTVGRQNGTIQLSDTLYDVSKNLVGYDTTTFDTLTFDGQPSVELRIVLEAIRDDIFVDDLALEYNKLFFSSLRYVFAEQNYVDWAFKTSFIKAQHNVGELDQKINFQNDNLPSYEKYIKEVKPYKTKIREYLSSYEKIDNSQSMTTDFDLPPLYIEGTDNIITRTVKVIDDNLVSQEGPITTYPDKHWADNAGYSIKEIAVADPGSGYVTTPVVTVTGGGGTGAIAKASLGRGGTITSIQIVTEGSGYLSMPTVSIDGTIADGGRSAKAVAILGGSPVRSMNTVVKFDRVSGEFEFINLSTTENFVATGSKVFFNLLWPMDLRTTKVTVSIDNTEVLAGNYAYKNILDTSKGYDRYYGQIEFIDPPADEAQIKIEYHKDISLLNAQDRINIAYEPTVDQFGKTLGQLMTGVDYGGVEVKSFDFGGISGWDSAPWMSRGWDLYDTTFEDEIIYRKLVEITFPEDINLRSARITQDNTNAQGSASVTGSANVLNVSAQFDQEFDTQSEIRYDDSTLLSTQIVNSTDTNINIDTGINANAIPSSIVNYLELAKPLEDGVTYNIYFKATGSDIAVRLDDPDYEGAPLLNKPDVVMASIVGDGVTTRINLDNINITFGQSDVFYVRKITSDGAFKPDNDSYDALIQGGDLSYQSATGLNSADINIDGDGFVTVTTSQGPEEVVPGQVVDTLDITVFEKSTGGASQIVSRNYRGDGQTVRFNIGDSPVTRDNLFVKIDNIIQEKNTYYIDFNTKDIVFNTAPADNATIFVASIGLSSISIIDIDDFVGDGETVEFLTNSRFEENSEAFVTINGKVVNVQLFKSDDTYELPGNYVIKFAEAPFDTAVIKLLIASKGLINVEYSQVTIDTIVADGSTLQYDLGKAPFTQNPSRAFMLVKVNDRFLNPGYTEQFEVTSNRNYTFDLTQVPVGAVNAYEIELYLNGRQLEYLQEWTYQGAGAFDDTKPEDEQAGSTITLERGVGDPGDKLQAYIITDAEFKLGYYESDNDFIKTPGTIHFNEPFNEDDIITVYQFSNHDSQGIETQKFVVSEKTKLTEGTTAYYEYRRLSRGIIELTTPAEDAQYVWVSVNGNLLTPSIDYSVTLDNRYIKLQQIPQENDVIVVQHFANAKITERFGWRQFKDMLNRTHYKRLETSYELAEDLAWTDKTIKLKDATNIPVPVFNSEYPGVIFIEGERIEYFQVDGNELLQIRRGTLGTGVKDLYLAGTKIIEQGADTNLPYKDETEVVTVEAGGYDIASTIYEDSPGVTVERFYFTSNNNSAFPLGGDPIPSIGYPGQSCVVYGTGFETNVKAIVGETECETTYVNDTELYFKTPALPVGAYDLVIVNPATNVPIDRAQTSVVVPKAIPYLQILLPFAPTPNPASEDQWSELEQTGWYKELVSIPVSQGIPGRGYIIDSKGTTDFTQIGAPNNLSGTEFIIPRDVDTTLLTGTGRLLDFASIPYEYWEAQDIEVFAGGRRLRKTPIAVYDYTAQDSPEGDKNVEAEFAVNKAIGAYVRLTYPPENGTNVTIVRKIGTVWSNPGQRLVDANSDVANFLLSSTTDVPR